MTTQTNDNDLIGKPQSSLDREDALVSRLSNIAYTEPTPVYSSRRSPFWFKIETTEQFVVKKKNQLARKSIEHIDQQIEERSRSYESELTPQLKSKIEEVREFFLTEIAPLTFASAAGGIQAKSVAERMLDTEIDSSMFSRFENMVNRAATIKMANFVLSYFKLDSDHFQNLVGNKPPDPLQDTLKHVMEAISEMPSKSSIDQQLKSGVSRELKAGLSTLRNEIKKDLR